MDLRCRPLAAALALAFSSTAMWQSAHAETAPLQEKELDNIQVRASRIKAVEPDAGTVDGKTITARRAATSDTTELLRDLPGVAVSSAGGVSGLPVLHGMADDRNRIKIDGMDLISACANHMNSPLSYIAPSNIESINVYAGISPVSLGGDSIGGSIIVKSKAPRFAEAGSGLLTSGELGSFYRSNGNAWGINASATVATENLSITYNGSTAQSENYKSAKEFKPGVMATQTTAGSHWIAGDEVGSSAYKAENHSLGIAYKLDNHLFDLKFGYQFIPYQGFPNQHMDMTKNESTQVNLGYTGRYGWGKLEARVYHEETRHKMDFAEDKQYYYGSAATILAPGMPMNTKGENTGALLKADIDLSARDTLRFGTEYQHYRLNDWWPPSPSVLPAGYTMGGMAPDTFININNGRRDRFDVFGEWEAQWNPQWSTLAGLRTGIVSTNVDQIHGYNTGMMYGNPNVATSEPGKFNRADRQRTDWNWDMTLLARYTPDSTQSYEGGFARKTRSPSLYERYTWSTNGMAMAMNNWINDGNGYVGNINLKPEVANTLSFTADWHDSSREAWGVKLTPYYTLVDNYIDAVCLTSKRACTGNQYYYLTLANQDARIYGLDLSGFAALGRFENIGNFTAKGMLSYTKGTNTSTDDHLYNIMPLNARLALEHRIGNWTNTIEEILVDEKKDVSAARRENKTAGYTLLNLRSSYEWKNFRFDIGLENALDKQYALPLGGAYIGQGGTMSIGSAGNYAWAGTKNPPPGYQVPGMGRSIYAGINIKF